MKIYKHLWERIITFDNFKLAYKHATKGKKHYTEVKYIQRYGVNRYLHKLLDKIVNKTYKVSEYKIFQLFTGNKWREIYKLPMRDRIVQHAIMNIIEPLFRETFIVDTYSSIKYKGTHKALHRVKQAIKIYNYKYCLKLDIHKCYPSLDKNILKRKLKEKFNDERLYELLSIIIDSCDKGVPIGNYTSQYFNNFYFNDFDHWCKEIKGIKAYFRYCDDIVILGDNKEDLHNLLNEIINKMSELNVRLKGNYQIFPVEKRGVDFLGYVVRNKYTKVRKRIKNNFIHKVSLMDFNNLTTKDINTLGSYWGIFVHCDARNLWFKYTKVKKFTDLNINVHKRDFVRDLIGIELIITNSVIYQKKGCDWLKFECSYNINKTEYKDVIVATSAEKLVEAGKQFNQSSYPFSTIIQIDNKGFYEFN